jgi:hypothetical protein
LKCFKKWTQKQSRLKQYLRVSWQWWYKSLHHAVWWLDTQCFRGPCCLHLQVWSMWWKESGHRYRQGMWRRRRRGKVGSYGHFQGPLLHSLTSLLYSLLLSSISFCPSLLFFFLPYFYHLYHYYIFYYHLLSSILNTLHPLC